MSDITKIGWLKEKAAANKDGAKKQKDRGPLILHIRDKPNMLLWSKDATLNEWNLLTREAIKRSKLRRACQQNQIQEQHKQEAKVKNLLPILQPHENNEIDNDQMYENASDIESQLAKPLPLPPSTQLNSYEADNVIASNQLSEKHAIGQDNCKLLDTDNNNKPKPALRSSTSPSGVSQKPITSVADEMGSSSSSSTGSASKRLVLKPRPDLQVPNDHDDDHQHDEPLERDRLKCNQQQQQQQQKRRVTSTDKDLFGSESNNDDISKHQGQNNDVSNGAQNPNNPKALDSLYNGNGFRDVDVAADKDNCNEISENNHDNEQCFDDNETTCKSILDQKVIVLAPEPPPRRTLIRRDDSWQSLVSLNKLGPSSNRHSLVKNAAHIPQAKPQNQSTMQPPLQQQQQPQQQQNNFIQKLGKFARVKLLGNLKVYAKQLIIHV